MLQRHAPALGGLAGGVCALWLSGAEATGRTAALLLLLLGVAGYTLSPIRSTRHIGARRGFHASHRLFGLEVASIWSRQIENSRHRVSQVLGHVKDNIELLPFA